MIKRNVYIGLKYKKEVDIAPKILFKYYCNNTDKITEVLEKYQIPIVKNRVLVHVLEQLPVGREIPLELYTLIAKIYIILYRHGYIKKENN